MSGPLPPSLARKAARSSHEREEALLDRYALMRAVRLGILHTGDGTPELAAWIIAAEEIGFTVGMAGEIAIFSKDEQAVFLAFDAPGGAKTWVWAP